MFKGLQEPFVRTEWVETVSWQRKNINNRRVFFFLKNQIFSGWKIWQLEWTFYLLNSASDLWWQNTHAAVECVLSDSVFLEEERTEGEDKWTVLNTLQSPINSNSLQTVGTQEKEENGRQSTWWNGTYSWLYEKHSSVHENRPLNARARHIAVNCQSGSYSSGERAPAENAQKPRLIPTP